MKKLLQIWVVLVIFASFIFSAYAEDNFVLSFSQQCEQEKIWDGRTTRKISSIKRYFKSLQNIQEEYDLDTYIYMMDGYYYDLETLKFVMPEIFRELGVLEGNLKHEHGNCNIEGEVRQHAGNNTLLITVGQMGDKIVPLRLTKYRNSQIETAFIVLQCPEDHPFLEKSDGESISTSVIRDGNYEYTTVMGGNKVVRKYIIPNGMRTEIVKLLASSLPPSINYRNYLRYMYYQGIIKDFEKGLIEPNPDCPCCKGIGKMKCEICSGKGKVGFECKSLEVIDAHSRTRKEYEKNTREVQTSSLKASRGGRRSSSREAKKIKAKENRRLAKEKRIRDGNVPCCICKKSGYLLCPECILVTNPKYSPHAKEEYLNRWKK